MQISQVHTNVSCSKIFKCFTCQLRVRAQDGGSPRLSSTTLLTITVQRNLAAPVFTQNSYTTTIPETQAPGSNILTLQATDSDLTVCMLLLLVVLAIKQSLRLQNVYQTSGQSTFFFISTPWNGMFVLLYCYYSCVAYKLACSHILIMLLW